MNIKETKQAVELLLKEPQAVTPYIHGMPGVGKSAIVSQIAEARGISFIDLRLSQLESADIRGIPTPDGKMGSSRWLPPETIPFENFKDLPVPGDPEERKFSDGGILFLDEFNRARFDVIQAAFQLVLDRRVGLHKLLDNWFIVCSGNLGEADNTEVTEITDAALNNRFAHFYVDEAGLFDTWIEWAENEGNIHSDVVNFMHQKPSALYVKPNEGDEIFCTPRSWEKFSLVLQQNEEIGLEKITQILGQAIIGSSTISFLDYLKEKKKVRPTDVLNDYKKYSRKIKAMDRMRKYSLSNEVLTYSKEHASFDKKQIENLHTFLTEDLDPDHMIAAFKSFSDIDIEFEGETQEFLDVYLDAYPEMNDKIADIIYGAQND